MGNNNVRATLEARPVATMIPRGTDAALDVVLRNDGMQPFWVNGRLLINSPQAPRSHRDILLLVVDPQGRRLDFECKVRAGATPIEKYLILQPGRSLSARVYLNECFDLDREGIYRIIAVFEDASENVPAPPEGAAVVSGPIESAAVQIHVIAANA